VPLLVQADQKGSFNSKSPSLKSKKKKEAKEVQVKYPYDERLPNMVGTTIDDFIQSIAEKKAKEISAEEAVELSEEIKH